MSDFDELDSLLGPLREPATPAELASEREMVDLMAKTHRHAKGTIMFSSRRARVATLIAAGVIGFGGVAAAGGGGLGRNDSGSTPVVSPEIEDDEVEEIEDDVEEVDEVEEIEDEGSDDDAFTDEIAKVTPMVAAETAVDDAAEIEVVIPCVEGGNHGETVRAVARGDEGFEEFEVRDAAHSDCGKTDDHADKVDDDDDAGEVDDSDDDVSDEVEDDDDSDDDDAEDDDAEDDDDEDRGSGNRQEEPGRGESHGNRGNGKPGDDD